MLPAAVVRAVAVAAVLLYCCLFDDHCHQPAGCPELLLLHRHFFLVYYTNRDGTSFRSTWS